MLAATDVGAQDYCMDEMYENVWRAMTQGLAETGEYIRVTSSGKHVWLQGSYNPVFDDQGHVVKVIRAGARHHRRQNPRRRS
jgi:methyl-accepting chemotaxis protein